MSIKRTLLAATALLLPAVAQAQPVSGLYVGAGAGVNWLQNSDVSLSGTLPLGQQRNGSLRFEPGWVALASLGFGFGNGLRAEVEGSFRENDIDNIRGLRGTSPGPYFSGGRVRNIGVMANVFYDFSFGNFPLQPYIGVGAGAAYTDYRSVNLRNFSAPAGAVSIAGNEWNFAYQAIAGAAFNVPGVPGLAFTAEYRFFATLDPEIDASVVRGGVRTAAKADVENYNHSILVGLRYNFGVRPPAPVVAPVAPVAPAPQVARTYLVFFDWDRADLTDRARQIIAEAAQNSRTAGVTRLEVSGHADRSGTPQYNQRLSERRAQAVAAELERRGVSRSQMVIQAFGESRPLVPTADGVREPQNRRVEIVLR